MAFDFPNSPTLDQVYAPAGGPSYKWNGYAWAKVPAAGGGSTIAVSDTPPGGAADNSIWVESDTMGMYLRYHDSDGSQWTQLNGMADLASYVKKTGDTMSGDLTISKSSPWMWLDGRTGGAPAYGWQMNGKDRFAFFLTDPETGSNVGSDLLLGTYSDAGAYTSSCLRVNRATGVITGTGIAPGPQASAGVGQWLALNSGANTALALPAGGTWCWQVHGYNTGTGTIAVGSYASISAGGTVIMGAIANTNVIGHCWRVL